DRAGAERATPSRSPALPADRRLWHAGDAGIPAPGARFFRRARGRRQARAAHRRRGLQSLRDRRDAGQSLRPARPSALGADGTWAEVRCFTLSFRGPVRRTANPESMLLNKVVMNSGSRARTAFGMTS